MGQFERVRASFRRAYRAGRASTRAVRVQAKGTEVVEDTRSAQAHPAPASAVHPSTISRDDADVPHGLRIAAAWSWRLLVIGVIGYALVRVVALLSHVFIPLAIALLLSALLTPAVAWLRNRKVPASLATFIVLVGGLAAVVGTLTLVINQFVNGAPKLATRTGEGLQRIQGWLKTGPLHLSDQQLNSMVESIQNWVNDNRDTLTTNAVNTAGSLFSFLAGLFLVLFATFFFLRDGRRIWNAIVSVLPSGARAGIGAAGNDSWGTLVAYVRATVLVAFIDALGIGIGIWALRVPFAFSLAALVFLAAFIPIVGATLSGSVAVLIALAMRGPIVALVLLGVVIGVQQLEGHVLQPLIMGRAVAIHPLAVITAIAAGVVIAGIIGALVAVPLVAVLNTAIRRLILHRREPPPEAVIVSADRPGP